VVGKHSFYIFANAVYMATVTGLQWRGANGPARGQTDTCAEQVSHGTKPLAFESMYRRKNKTVIEVLLAKRFTPSHLIRGRMVNNNHAHDALPVSIELHAP
jgi:hypothetical protein